jgi:hemerythrin superfamily protein
MSIYETVRRDHRGLERHFDDLLAETDDIERRRQLFDTLRTDLIAHARAEEEAFYPLLQPHAPDRVRRALDQHARAEQKLEEIARMKTDDPRFLAEVEALSEMVLAHLQEEEEHLFPLARRHVGDDLDGKLGNRLAREEEKERRVLEPHEM